MQTSTYPSGVLHFVYTQRFDHVVREGRAQKCANV